MRLDDPWALLFRASLPPTPGLTASSCTYGREFATRFFQLRLAATPCVSLRLPSSAPIGSFHPTRFCPCWAHPAAGLTVRRFVSSKIPRRLRLNKGSIRRDNLIAIGIGAYELIVIHAAGHIAERAGRRGGQIGLCRVSAVDAGRGPYCT